MLGRQLREASVLRHSLEYPGGSQHRVRRVYRNKIRQRKEKLKMSFRKLIPWSGIALFLTGVLFVITSLAHPSDFDPNAALSSLWAPVHVLLTFAFLLSLFGLVGLYARLQEQSGTLGLVAFILALFGSGLSIIAGAVEAYVEPFLASQQATPQPPLALIDPAGPLSGLLLFFLLAVIFFFLGYTLMGVVIVRTRVLPRWAGWLLIIGTVLTNATFLGSIGYVPRVIGGVIFGIALGWLGYALWSEKGVTTAQA